MKLAQVTWGEYRDEVQDREGVRKARTKVELNLARYTPLRPG